jgi:rhamnosyltransferase
MTDANHPTPADDPQAPPTPADTAAVVVAWHPDALLPSRIAAVASQVDKVLVVDNASTGTPHEMLLSLARRGDIELLQNPDNLGVATALNQGADYAIRHGYRWLLTMDQDTFVSSHLMAGLRETFLACPFRDRLAVVAANYVDPAIEKLFARTNRPHLAYIEQPTAITSGTLLRLSAYAQTGAFQDDFFIDFVDNEYCLRLRNHGWRVAYSTTPLMDHAIGTPCVHRLFGYRFATSNHSPLRRYYMTRNRVISDCRHWQTQPHAVVTDIGRFAGEFLFILLFETEKCRKIQAIARGAWHGITGRMGRLRTP